MRTYSAITLAGKVNWARIKTDKNGKQFLMVRLAVGFNKAIQIYHVFIKNVDIELAKNDFLLNDMVIVEGRMKMTKFGYHLYGNIDAVHWYKSVSDYKRSTYKKELADILADKDYDETLPDFDFDLEWQKE